MAQEHNQDMKDRPHGQHTLVRVPLPGKSSGAGYEKGLPTSLHATSKTSACGVVWCRVLWCVVVCCGVLLCVVVLLLCCVLCCVLWCVVVVVVVVVVGVVVVGVVVVVVVFVVEDEKRGICGAASLVLQRDSAVWKDSIMNARL